MSTKKKLLISLCSLCLVAAVVVIGVFAFATQTFTINNRVSFTASDVKAEITVTGTNGTEAIKMSGEETALTWTIDASDKADAATTKTIPDQAFTVDSTGETQKANPITFKVQIKNTGSTNFTATVSDTTLQGLAAAANLEVGVSYGYQEYDATTTSLKDSVAGANGQKLNINDIFTVSFTYTVTDLGLTADLNQALQFTLAAVSA